MFVVFIVKENMLVAVTKFDSPNMTRSLQKWNKSLEYLSGNNINMSNVVFTALDPHGNDWEKFHLGDNTSDHIHITAKRDVTLRNIPDEINDWQAEEKKIITSKSRMCGRLRHMGFENLMEKLQRKFDTSARELASQYFFHLLNSYCALPCDAPTIFSSSSSSSRGGVEGGSCVVAMTVILNWMMMLRGIGEYGFVSVENLSKMLLKYSSTNRLEMNRPLFVDEYLWKMWSIHELIFTLTRVEDNNSLSLVTAQSSSSGADSRAIPNSSFEYLLFKLVLTDLYGNEFLEPFDLKVTVHVFSNAVSADVFELIEGTMVVMPDGSRRLGFKLPLVWNHYVVCAKYIGMERKVFHCKQKSHISK